MRVALVQLNPVVGDIAGNVARARDALVEATHSDVALTLLPELAITGYPPEDLLLRPGFSAEARAGLDDLAAGVRRGVVVVGFPEWDRDCHNSAAVIADGRVQAVYRKRFLPNYGVFDEARYFRAGQRALVVEAAGLRLGIVVCEDVWYPGPVSNDLAAAAADVICCISASPYHRGKGDRREAMLATRAADAATPLLFCNQVGGQDELVFDGRSAVFDAAGEVVARAPQFQECVFVCELQPAHAARRRLRMPLARQLPDSDVETTPIEAKLPSARGRCENVVEETLGAVDEVWAALRLGIADYVDKNRFPGVLVGLSGGVDSALTAALATAALGPERVVALSMPSVFTSDDSVSLAGEQARRLGIRLSELPIVDVVRAFEATLASTLAGKGRDVTEENIQARARGTLLMAVSNKLGSLVLAPGNKSEMSVGYTTLYGDMVGGFAPLRDVSKSWVYRLATVGDDDGPFVVPAITRRAPTAELRPDQLDSDSLPPYQLLDRVLEGYVEEDLGVDELLASGLPEAEVRRVVRMVDRSEYKRRQGPVGIKITARAFGKDRRMPITNLYG